MSLFRRGAESTESTSTTQGSLPSAPLPSAPSPLASLPPLFAPQTSTAPAENGDDVQQLREEIAAMHRIITEVADKGSAQEKVFDVLHSELQDYKNDFIYEHLKPVLWPLLFLFDSLEQYAREIVGQVGQSGDSRLDAREVLDHLRFFRGQLVESLRICEVTPMKQPSGEIDPKHHKGIGVETVKNASEENTIRRVVRTGWFLNGKVLRHAEVIIGKRAEAIRNSKIAAGAIESDQSGANTATVRASSDASASGGGRGS